MEREQMAIAQVKKRTNAVASKMIMLDNSKIKSNYFQTFEGNGFEETATRHFKRV